MDEGPVSLMLGGLCQQSLYFDKRKMRSNPLVRLLGYEFLTQSKFCYHVNYLQNELFLLNKSPRKSRTTFQLRPLAIRLIEMRSCIPPCPPPRTFLQNPAPLLVSSQVRKYNVLKNTVREINRKSRLAPSTAAAAARRQPSWRFRDSSRSLLEELESGRNMRVLSAPWPLSTPSSSSSSFRAADIHDLATSTTW